MSNNINSYGFLFGAGAEVSFGMPLGSSFALNIFREDKESAKEEVLKQVEAYPYNDFIPKFNHKPPISVFSRTSYRTILQSCFEQNKDKILKSLNKFDSIVENIIESDKNNKFNTIFENISDTDGIVLTDVINSNLLDFKQDFVNSKYLGKFLYLYKLEKDKQDSLLDKDNGNFIKDFKKILTCIIELYLGTISQNEIDSLNNSIEINDSFNLFDDFSNLFSFNYDLSGIRSLEYLLGLNITTNNSKELCYEDRIILLLTRILEKLVGDFFDYKLLIDEYWHYLYYPHKEWGKFCKISVFLYTVRNYINKSIDYNSKVKNSYYHQIFNFFSSNTDNLKISAIATSNYTPFIKQILNKITDNIFYLNGSIEEWYDPRLNRIILNKDNSDAGFLVPLIYTQSGTKPLTSITKTQEYSSLYNEWKKSKAVVVIGFNFGSDDEHINCMLRDLIDFADKKIYVVYHKNDIENKKNDIIKKLKISKNKEKNIDVVYENYGKWLNDITAM